MRGLALLFSLHFGGGDEHPGGDRWFAADKAKHFVTAAFVQSLGFSGFRAIGLGRTSSLIGASVLTGAVSVGKEVWDAKGNGTPSAKDLAWDVAGAAAASALLAHTER